MKLGKDRTFSKLSEAYQKLKTVLDLFESGIRSQDRNIYLGVESARLLLESLPINYYRKLDISSKFQELFKFGNISQRVILLNSLIYYQVEGSSGFYKNKKAEKELEEYFSTIDDFVENSLMSILKEFETLFDDVVLIKSKFLSNVIDENILKSLKLIIIETIEKSKYHSYLNLNYNILNDYGRELELDYNASISNIEIEEKWISNNISLEEKKRALSEYAEYMLRSINADRALEIISDFNMGKDSIKIKIEVSC